MKKNTVLITGADSQHEELTSYVKELMEFLDHDR